VRDHEGRYPLLADEDLISLVGDGHAQAFAVLYDRHSRAAYSLAYRMMNGRQEQQRTWPRTPSSRSGARQQAIGLTGAAYGPGSSP
jgi:hypothetical protein